MPCRHGVPLSDEHYNAYEQLFERYGRWNDVAALCPCLALKPPAWFTRSWEDQLELERVTRIEEENWKARYEERKKSPDQGVRSQISPWIFATLTQPDDVEGCDQLLNNVANMLKSKQVSPIEWCYSLELTDKGTPHVHMDFRSSLKYLDYGKIAKLNNNGVRGEGRKFWRTDIQKDRGSAQSYIIKPKSKPSKEWLEDHGLDTWFFCSENYSGVRPNIFEAHDIKNGEGQEDGETRSQGSAQDY